MAVDYAGCAKGICEAAGGRDNLISAAHCATRLRLVVADHGRIDMEKLENTQGVRGAFCHDGQLQVIIGPGVVNRVYEAFLEESGMHAATKEEVKETAKEAAGTRQSLPGRMVRALGDVFIPILPAIVASGLMMGLVETLGRVFPTFAASGWYGILDLAANTAFIFLPVLVAISAAGKFGGNLFLGAVIGMIMIHPDLVNAWSVGSLDVVDIPVWHLFGGFSIRQVGYQGHVIPVIIAVWIMCGIEKRLHRHVPEMIDLFVTPLCTVVLTAFLALGIIGPVFSMAESHMLEFAVRVITMGSGAGAAVMGAVYPLTVVGGIHHMYHMIEAGMLAADGRNIWMPIASAANFAQGAACLAVGLKAGDARTRSAAIPSSLSAALGITEPAVFGVNLRYGKPFLCGMAGGAAGALAGAVLRVGATSYGVTGIPGFLITPNQAVRYGIVLAVSFGVSFGLTWFLWKEGTGGRKNMGACAGDMNPVSGRAETVIYAPLQGRVIGREEIPDETFASGILGEGVGIEPETGVVSSPFDGVVSVAADTGHMIGLVGPGGMEVLIHVGIDTVNMKGEGFELQVSKGDSVKAGQTLLVFDIGKIRAAGYSSTTAVLLSNSAGYPGFRILRTGSTDRMDPLMSII